MLIVVGTNFKYSPVEVREKLFFSKARIKDTLKRLVDFKLIKGAVILSTCNRVEIYASTEDAFLATNELKNFLADYHHQGLERIEMCLYTYIGKGALLHLCSVAAGLDSQILGEPQILEQVKFAFEEARECGYTDDLLSNVFSYSLKVAEKVRIETQIQEGNISIGSIVLSLIKDKIGILKGRNILIIGVGKVSELVTRYLKEETVSTIFISNRTFKNAKTLAKEVGGIALRFDQLKEKLREADVIISATRSPHLILKKEDVLEAISHKPSASNYQPLLIIDLAVPRDVEPEVKYIKGVELFCLDELDFIIEKELQKRRLAMPKAQEIIKEEAEKIWSLAEPLELEYARAL